jgi:hypothetical protein
MKSTFDPGYGKLGDFGTKNPADHLGREWEIWIE